MQVNNQKIKKELRRGERLRDGKAHTIDHSRRSFLHSLGIAGASGFFLNKLPVNTLSPSPLTQALVEGDDERVLVIIRLKGGNDGLNTFIPLHDYGTYQSLRPNLQIPRNELVGFSEELQGHPQLRPLQSLWEEGQMRVIQNVGYPEPNLSHFRSSDIWATASDSDVVEPSGALGRYLEETYPDFLTNPPETPPAIQIGGAGNLLFNNADDFNYAISTENPQQLAAIAESGRLYDIANLPDCTYGEQLGYVRGVANTTFRYAGVLADAYEMGRNTAEYHEDRLGVQLALVARMLRGGLKTRLFVVELDGFDTHAEQLKAHANLLNSVSRNTRAFFEDMKDGELEDRVLAMTISEFGRRIFENGSMGTDHGSSAPMMLFGKGLNGNGMIGGLPDLAQVDGTRNLIYQTDFRSVYATVFSDWLCLPTAAVENMVGGPFPRMENLGLVCQGITSSTDPNTSASTLAMKVYQNGADVVVEYELPAAADVGIHFFDVSGRKISTPFKGKGLPGENLQRLRLNSSQWASGIYIVSLEVNGRMYSRKLGFFR